MFTIIPDCQLTRRKRVHFVIRDNGDVAFSAADLSACINWLFDQGDMAALVEVAGHDHPWTIRLEVHG